jgi:hypothetical protein
MKTQWQLLKNHHSNTHAHSEPWFVKYWRSSAAWIYLFICVFDFVVMPIYMARTNLTLDQIMAAAEKLRPEDRVAAINFLLHKNLWTPLTLVENGMFHIAFGAILGVSAWSRGRVQQSQVENGIFPAVEEIGYAPHTPLALPQMPSPLPVPPMPSMPSMPPMPLQPTPISPSPASHPAPGFGSPLMPPPSLLSGSQSNITPPP